LDFVPRSVLGFADEPDIRPDYTDHATVVLRMPGVSLGPIFFDTDYLVVVGLGIDGIYSVHQATSFAM
jgi:hypothetical protein